MFTLRRAAIATPRALTRSLATTSRHTFLRASTLSSIRTQLPSTAIKAFSTSIIRFDGSSQTLAAKLQNELQLETENSDGTSTQSDENVQKFIDAHDWDVTDNEGEQTVKLSRKYEDETIEVTFSIADFPPPYGEEDEVDEALLDEEDMEAQSGGANTKGAINQGRTSGGNFKVAPEDSIAPGDRPELADVEDDISGSQTPFAANATVTVRKDGKVGALRIELVAEDGEFSIHSIAQLASDEAVKAINPVLPAGVDKHYTGPPFQQLDEELQSFFEAYLDDRGIDEALALFIPDYIDVKEQKEYLAWLKRVKDFVE